MPKFKGFLSEDKAVIAADKRYFRAFWITSICAILSVIISILLVSTIFVENSIAQAIVMFIGASVTISILILGTITMESANEDFLKAAESAFHRRMAEQISKLYKPHV